VHTESVLQTSPSESEGRIGFFGIFTSAALESAFRQRHFRDDLWLSGFLVTAATLRVLLLFVADYHHFGLGAAFWPLLAGRLLFLVVSAWVLIALRRATSAAVADRLFFWWSLLLGLALGQAAEQYRAIAHELRHGHRRLLRDVPLAAPPGNSRAGL
jgi:hypothetical protein